MSGLQNLCKLYGKMKVGNVLWVWDYVNDKPRKKSEMTKAELAASDAAKYKQKTESK